MAINKIQSIPLSYINALSDVKITSPYSGDALVFDGSKWTNQSGGAGISGYSGYSGTSGISGWSGISGLNGTDGISGYSGYSGYSGLNGQDGVSGISGYSGFSGSGISGYSGYSGISGNNGASGISGYSGLNGQDGVSGISGYSGFSGSGISGYSGYSGLSGSASLSGLTLVKSLTIINPATAYGISSIIPIWIPDANITITKIEVRCNADPTTEVTGDLKYADDRIGLGSPTVINDIDTTNGTRTDTSMASGSVAAGKQIYLSFDASPDVATTDLSINIYFDED